MDAAAELRQMVSGYQVSQALHVAAALGVSDVLAAEPRSLDELAEATDSHPRSLGRLMRALEAAGVYRMGDDGRYVNDALGEQLRSDSPGSNAGWAAFIGRPHHWRSWGDLLHSVRTGENAFQHLYDTSVWEYRQQRPAEQQAFDRAMNARSGAVAEAVARSYDFGRFETVCDVGGGTGTLLAAILSHHIGVRGVLFDQPDVVARSTDLLAEAGVADRCETSGGSFFDAVPAGAQAYVLKAIIHDWPDEESVAILRTIRAAMPESAALLLVEQLLDGADLRMAAFSDLNMMVGPGGQERTRGEYSSLFEAAGFELTGTTETGTQVFVIEGRPTAAPR